MAGNTNTTLETPPIDGWERANIMLIGDTGAGKSELRNSIFGRVISPADAGNPQLGITYTVSPDGGLGFYDVEGRTKGVTGVEYLQYLDQKVETQWDGHPEEKVHIVWYCIEADNARFAEPEVQTIKNIQALGIAVVVVVTKCPMTGGLIEPQEASFIQDIINKKIKKLAIGTSVPVCAKADAETPTQFGLDTLLDRTREIAPEAVRHALDAGQRINLERKREAAEAKLTAFASYALLEAGAPVPLVGVSSKIYTKLIRSLCAIYRVKIAPDDALTQAVLKAAGKNNQSALREINKLVAPVVDALATQAAKEVAKQGTKEFGKKGLGKIGGGPAVILTSIAAGTYAAFQCEAIGMALIETLEHSIVEKEEDSLKLAKFFNERFASSSFQEIMKLLPNVGAISEALGFGRPKK